MTASQVIHELESLPPAEQAEVIRFAYRLDTERKLSGGELTALAERMIATNDPVKTASIRAEITRGFYGTEAHA